MKFQKNFKDRQITPALVDTHHLLRVVAIMTMDVELAVAIADPVFVDCVSRQFDSRPPKQAEELGNHDFHSFHRVLQAPIPSSAAKLLGDSAHIVLCPLRQIMKRVSSLTMTVSRPLSGQI